MKFSQTYLRIFLSSETLNLVTKQHVTFTPNSELHVFDEWQKQLLRFNLCDTWLASQVFD